MHRRQGKGRPPQAAKKQSLAEARQRLTEKKKAARKETLQVRYGVSTEAERKALAGGFLTGESKPDVQAYKQHVVTQAKLSAREVVQRLREVGFTPQQLDKIDGNKGGTQALEAIFTHWDALQGRDLPREQIVKIASNNGGTQALEAVLTHWDALQRLGLSRKQIAQIAGYRATRKTLEAIATHPWSTVLTPQELTTLTSRINSSLALGRFLQNREDLEKRGMSKAEILRWAASGKAVDAAAPAADAGRKRATDKTPTTPERKRQKSTAAATVKPEPVTLGAAFPAPRAGVEVAQLNTAQLRHVPTTSYAMIDLTTPGGPAQTVFTVRHPDEAIVSTSRQTYDPALEQVFPIRSPAHPERVHPAYAAPGDPRRCAPQVTLQGIHFYKGGASLTETTLWQLARQHFPNLPFQNKDEFITALKRSCKEELTATMQGRPPPSAQQVRIAAISASSQCDSPEEFAALQNQYGGFLTDYAPARQPSLGNGRVVCLFAGARLASDEDDQHYLEQFGQRFGLQALQDYAANIQQYGSRKQELVTWAPYGGGNMGQYFNSSFKPGEQGKLQVDTDKTNALLCPVMVDLTDRHGQARRESMMMVLQNRPIAAGKQIKLDYGSQYTLEAQPPPSRTSQPVVKQEIVDAPGLDNE